MWKKEETHKKKWGREKNRRPTPGARHGKIIKKNIGGKLKESKLVKVN